jgi:medium-chain acyl-[acyl-carrier-protein] hydrolase
MSAPTTKRLSGKKSWFGSFKPNPKAQLRLFCFPYAGGGASVYRSWEQQLPSLVEVRAVQLPGRENRMGERPFTRVEPLVEALAEALLPFLDLPFAFFGHSMGAVVAFELARKLRTAVNLEPRHLFVSGRIAPHIVRVEPPNYNLPDPELIEELRRLDGTPEEALEHPELMGLMLPLLRADFELVQTYSYADGAPLGCSVTAFGGLKDKEVSREELAGWREHTAGDFSLRMFEGGHFFLHAARSQILAAVSAELLETSEYSVGVKHS